MDTDKTAINLDAPCESRVASWVSRITAELPNDSILYADVGGLEILKKEIRECIEYPMKYLHHFNHFGQSPSKGFLLFGPPGCGKSMLIKATANECKVNLLVVDCADFQRWWKSMDSSNDDRNPTHFHQLLFDKAKAASPCIVLFQERETETGTAAAHVYVFGTTTRPDVLDPILFRPGRLDQLIYVPLPDEPSRCSILKVLTRRVPVAEDVDFETIATVTEGYCGADLNDICKRAIRLAMRDSILREIDHKDQAEDQAFDLEQSVVTRSHFEECMRGRRGSVAEAPRRRYEVFAQTMFRGFTPATFSFQIPPANQAEEDQSIDDIILDDGLYDDD